MTSDKLPSEDGRKSGRRQGPEAPAIPTGRRWLTISQAAAFLSINPKTASAWCLTHRLPAARIGGRGPWRVDLRRLEESLDSQIKDINGRRGRIASRIPSCASAPLVHYRRGDPGEKKSAG